MTLEHQQIDELVTEVLDAHDAWNLPVDPFRIALAEGIKLAPGEYSGAFDGCLEYVRPQGVFILYYQDSGNEDGRTRFTISHELAHYFVPQHHEQILSGERHGSQAGVFPPEGREREADEFAARLLMPTGQFRRQMRDASCAEMGRLASLFHTSLTATVHRIVSETDQACSVVFSDGKTVSYAKHSEDMRVRGLHGIKKGDSVPSLSQTALFAKSGTRDKALAVTMASTWYKSHRAQNRDDKVWEEVMERGQYGYVTLLVYEPE